MPFQWYITCPKILKTLVAEKIENRKIICSCVATIEHVGQKDRS